MVANGANLDITKSTGAPLFFQLILIRFCISITVEPRYLELAYFELPLISK